MTEGSLSLHTSDLFPLRDTSIFNEYLSIETVKNQFPSNMRIVYGVPERNEKGVKSDVLPFYAMKTIEGSDKARLEGDGVQQALQDYDDRGRPAIKMLMTKQGERIWGEMTTDNVGKPLAIVLDNIVYSAPNVINPITSGTSEISGSFTIQEAQDLANILQSGKVAGPCQNCAGTGCWTNTRCCSRKWRNTCIRYFLHCDIRF